MIKYSGIIVFIVLNGIGFLMLRKAIKSRQLGKKAEEWLSTTATVLESSIEEDPGRNAMGQLNIFHVLHVEYEYIVAEKKYHGNRVSFGKPAFEFLTASNYLEQYAAGKEVPVYYNPADPSDCVLAPKTTVGMMSVIPGIFFIVSGILIGLLSVFA